VCIHLQKALAQVKRLDPEKFGGAVDEMSSEAARRAEEAGLFPDDLDALTEIRRELGFKD
jgi:hypothetical protein